VIEFFKSDQNLLVLTDSGGVQEEFNLLQKPCLTCRFNTDRPETITNGGNILVPPFTPEFITDEVKFVFNNDEMLDEMRKAPSLYGSKSGGKLITIVKELMDRNAPLISWAHTEMKLFQDEDTDFGFK
jgi:UDP-N-acetylglucosamine 2-epimerase (non-hydrolysing)